MNWTFSAVGLGPSYSNFGDIQGLGATPTFVQTLFIDKQIPEPIFGMYINPLGADDTAEGKITFGGIDKSRIQGDDAFGSVWFILCFLLTWIGLGYRRNYLGPKYTQPLPMGIQRINSTASVLSQCSLYSPGLIFQFRLSYLDWTHTQSHGLCRAWNWCPFVRFAFCFSLKILTMAYFISDSFSAMRNVYNGTVETDSNSVLFSFLSFNTSIIPSLPSLNITIGSETFSIPSSKYIVPRELYPMLGVTDVPDLARTWIASAGPGAFNLGQNALQNIYTAYDSECFSPSLSFPHGFTFFLVGNNSMFTWTLSTFVEHQLIHPLQMSVSLIFASKVLLDKTIPLPQ